MGSPLQLYKMQLTSFVESDDLHFVSEVEAEELRS